MRNVDFTDVFRITPINGKKMEYRLTRFGPIMHSPETYRERQCNKSKL